MSEKIVMSQVKELTDPKVRKVAMRVVKTFQLAAEKAVAHSAEPDTFPIPSNPKSLEQLFLSRFQESPEPKRSAAITRLMPVIKASKAKRTRLYGDLNAVDLSSDMEVRQQVKALPFSQELKFSSAQLPTLVHPINNIVFSGGVSQPLATNEKLECRIHKVHCLDETNSFLEPEWSGSDEIALGGSAIDATGVAKKIDEFKAGSFNDGDEKSLYRKVFATFDLLAGTEWPKSYFVVFALAEKDAGGFASFLNKLVDDVKEDITTALATSIGTAIGTASGGVIGAIIGAAVGFAVGKIIEWLKGWWGDETFDPLTISVEIPSLEHRWTEDSPVSPKNIIEFKGHNGHYQLTYDWRLYGEEAQEYCSIEAFNYRGHFIRHRNYRGELDAIESSLDKKDSTFKIVPGLAGKGLSFESFNLPGYYLRHRNFEIWLDKGTDDELFKKDASFLPTIGLARSYGSSYCSLNYPEFYIRHRNFRLYLEKGDDDLFRKDATFFLSKARWWF